MNTHSLQVTMDDITGMEIPEAVGNVSQLVMRMSMGGVHQEGHPQVEVGLHLGFS